ncbi:MAG: antibiotic acetyltransferase, partial [Planctomycetes bacterium]|nr:antibiotic acetyltransferase [Planctomycetota bacterium]
VGDEATIGMGTTIYPDLHIGRRAVIVNGVNLTRNVPDHDVVKLRAPVSLKVKS